MSSKKTDLIKDRLCPFKGFEKCAYDYCVFYRGQRYHSSSYKNLAPEYDETFYDCVLASAAETLRNASFS